MKVVGIVQEKIDRAKESHIESLKTEQKRIAAQLKELGVKQGG